MRSKIYTFLSAAAVALLLPSPEVAAQFIMYSGGVDVYRLEVGKPDSVVLSFHPKEKAKASQERDFSTVGGEIPDASQVVDLGLPSGTLWSPWNVGANMAGEAGAYFAWGEVQACNGSPDWSTYWWMAEGKSDKNYLTKYQRKDGQTSAIWYDSTASFVGDGKTTLEASDDAATVNWGGKWRMPTPAELQELCDNCTWEWKDENEYTTGSIAGCLITGPNGASIFLPAAGMWLSEHADQLGALGFYWSSELVSGSSFGARLLSFVSLFHSAGGNVYSDRYHGFPVRAVCSPTE